MSTSSFRAPTRRTPPQNQAASGKAAPIARRVLRLKAVGFKPHPNPYTGDEAQYQQFTFKVLADMSFKEAIGNDMLSEQAWARVNPRGRKLVGNVIDAIEQTWNQHPGEFYRINRGIVISAESVQWDKVSETVEIVLTDRQLHGILDGAHTLAKVVDDLIPDRYGHPADGTEDEDGADEEEQENEGGSKQKDAYLTCEVWVGLSLEEVVRLTSGRNTSRTVPPYAISNLRGDFSEVEETLRRAKPEYAKDVVAFRPNEHVYIEPVNSDDPEPDPKFKPISILEILQLMMCMDVTNYPGDEQPIDAYKNQGFVPKFWDKGNEKNRIAEYRKMLPILPDLLELYDQIRETVPIAYDQRPNRGKTYKHWNKVLAKNKERVESVKRQSLYYLEPDGTRKTYRAPMALFYPMMCAFRACLKAGPKSYEWIGGKKPTKWNDGDFHEACSRLGVTIAQLAAPKDSLHAVGRDEAVWLACYNSLDKFLFEYELKKRVH